VANHHQQILHQMTKTSLTSDDIQNLLTLIDFHDDWDEVKDIWGFDIEPLFNKLNDMLQDA
jgi:Na+/phosphate symporter